MDNFEAIILDLDGTLLDDNKKIGSYTKEILKSIKSNIKVIIASARQFYRMKPYLKELSLDKTNDYSICLNGAVVTNNNEKIISYSYIMPSIVCQIDRNLLDNYTDIKWIYYLYNEQVIKKDIDNIDYFAQKNKIYKIVGIADEKEIEKFKKCIPNDMLSIAEFSSSTSDRIEIVSKGTNKLSSLKLLLEKLGIDKENCIAIGDGENDIPILKYVGYGFSMKNAPQTVKEAVKRITNDTNNEDGVGKLIEEIYHNLRKENNYNGIGKKL